MLPFRWRHRCQRTRKAQVVGNRLGCNIAGRTIDAATVARGRPVPSRNSASRRHHITTYSRRPSPPIFKNPIFGTHTCHEVAHIALGLPSDHKELPWWSYAKRSPNEIFCDVFAAELLLPYKLFKPLVEKTDISLTAVDDLADRFVASNMATGSRFATLASAPCAFVLSEQGKVRYTSRSTALREARAWITPRMALPQGSVSERLRAGGTSNGPEEVKADVWFNDWDRGGALLEDARHLRQWDQTIALLWFEDEEVPQPKRDHREREEEEFGLAELDGVLPWPGKKRRK